MFKALQMNWRRWVRWLKQLWGNNLGRREHHDDDDQKLQRAFMRAVLQSLQLIIRKLTEILSRLPPEPKEPTHMTLRFGDPTSSFEPTFSRNAQTQGETNMPGKETDSQTIPCSAIETDEDGKAVTLNPANVTWTLAPLDDGTSIATVTSNADGSATFKATKVGGPSVVSCVDSGVTLPDGTPLTGTNTLEVTASTKTASAMALVFGDPQASTA